MTAAIAVTKQGPRLEVHTARTLLVLVASNLSFPVHIVQVASGARLVGLGGYLQPSRRNVLSMLQPVTVTNADAPPAAIAPNALGRRDVVATTQRFDGNPVSVKVQLIRDAVEVMRDLVVVGRL